MFSSVGLVLMLKTARTRQSHQASVHDLYLSGDNSYLALDGCISAVDEVRLKV